MLQRVERDNANRIVKLARHHIGDYGFEVRTLDLSFAVNCPKTDKTVDHKVDGLIRAVGYDPRGPASARHTYLPANDGDLSTKTETALAQK